MPLKKSWRKPNAPLTGIRSMRDTDQDWSEIGAADPFWGVLTNPAYRGQPDAEALERFYLSGKHDIADVMRRIGLLFGRTRFARALDFGCGVGRLVNAMADHAEEVTGLDVSPGMIAQAKRHVTAANAQFTLDMPDGPFDWINSYIVFQHIPPIRGLDLLQQLLARTSYDAVLSLHFPLYKSYAGSGMDGTLDAYTYDGTHLQSLIERDRGSAAITMYDYPFAAVFAILTRAGFADLHLAATDHGGQHGAWVFAARL